MSHNLQDVGVEIREDETVDEIRGVKVIQKKKGYRVSIDPFLLADFADLRGIKKATDLGTGSGIIAILLARRSVELRVTGVELQEDLYDMAERNVRLSPVSGRVEIVKGDLKTLKNGFEGGSFDLVVSNPPYHPVGKGRIGRNTERTVARHEVAVNMNDIVEASDFLLREKGKVVLIYPASRLGEIISIMGGTEIGLRRLREVHTKDIELVMVEGEKGYDGEFTEDAPLCL